MPSIVTANDAELYLAAFEGLLMGAYMRARLAGYDHDNAWLYVKSYISRHKVKAMKRFVP